MRVKKLFFLVFVLSSLLVGCGENTVSYSEVKQEQVNENVKRFIQSVQRSQDIERNGIYKYYDEAHIQYLYVTQDFLTNGKGFGGLDIETDKDSMHVYLKENDEPTEDTYWLYRIKSNREFTYSKIYKNGEETYFGTIGVSGD